ncbi:MAG TPA: hypothetical protein PLN91_07835 [Rhodanobacteraceae bacterium]|nr:hypothetical protein [Rhodanobacteraceae bacterium]
MEFHIALGSARADLSSLQDVLRDADPAATVDLDPNGSVLRVAAELSPAELAQAMRRAGLEITPLQVVQQPSICCGGCGG